MNELREKLPLPPSNLEGLEPGFRDARIIRDVVCYNQGALFEYHYVGAQLHRELRLAQQDCQPDGRPSEAARERIQSALDKLVVFLDSSFREIVRNNFLYLDYFFACTTGSSNPRISLMAPTDSAGRGAIDLYRHPLNSASFSVRDTSKFTAFSEVNRTGSFYVCNNIPLFLQKGEFSAPRLRKDVPVPEECIESTEELDIAWLRMWEGADPESARSDHNYSRSFYKSTLVIPLTFAKNTQALSNVFFDLYKGDDLYGSIFGYLCLDSTRIDYFKNSSCIDIGYVVADHICYLMILSRIYTQYSETFNDLAKYADPAD